MNPSQSVNVKLPHKGDLVLCEITSIQPHCAFAMLKEYEGLEGMIHISEVASSWIRDIKSFVREGKEVVCKVMDVDPYKKHISLSLRRVSDEEKGEKYEQLKREKKSSRMLERVAEIVGNVRALREKLVKEFGELYFAFEAAAQYGEGALTEKGITPKQASAIAEVAKASITFPEVSIGGTLILQSGAPDGVESIKGVLLKAESMGAKVQYISAPRYSIKITAQDYKTAEKRLKSIVEFSLEEIGKAHNHGSGEFIRTQNK